MPQQRGRAGASPEGAKLPGTSLLSRAKVAAVGPAAGAASGTCPGTIEPIREWRRQQGAEGSVPHLHNLLGAAVGGCSGQQVASSSRTVLCTAG